MTILRINNKLLISQPLSQKPISWFSLILAGLPVTFILLLVGVMGWQAIPALAQYPPPPLPLRSVHLFSSSEIGTPRSIIKATDGNFYGQVFYGGGTGGNIFRITPSGVFTIIHHDTVGYPESYVNNAPFCSLVEAGDHCIYYRSLGAVAGIYKFDLAGNFSLVKSFADMGIDPEGFNTCNALTVGTDGLVYGVTYAHTDFPNNGNGHYEHTHGTLFSINPSGSVTFLFDLPERLPNGQVAPYLGQPELYPGLPYPSLERAIPTVMQANNGLFYLTETPGDYRTQNDGGISSITSSGIQADLKVFVKTDLDTLGTPTGPLVQAADGNFYGTTTASGAYDYGSAYPPAYGTIFQITPAGSFSVLHKFKQIYGSSNFFNAADWPYIEYTGFGSPGEITDGYYPSPLTIAANGDLYGESSGGGFYQAGTLFKLTSSGQYTQLYTFSGLDSVVYSGDGQGIIQSVVQGNDGNIYGLSWRNNNYGTFFELVLNPPAQYSITDLGALGGTLSHASAINNQGQVVGYSTTTNALPHAFLWNPTSPNALTGQMQDLGVLPGGVESIASGINNNGQIVGTAYDQNQNPQGFLWDSGTLTALGTLGGSFSSISSINDFGQAVGTAETVGEDYHNVVIDTKVQGKVDNNTFAGNYFNSPVYLNFVSNYTPNYSRAYSVSNIGRLDDNDFEIAGEAETPTGDIHAVCDSLDGLKDLGVLSGGSYSSAFSVNDRFQIVGEGDTDNGDIHACIWSGGVRSDLGALPSSSATDSSALAINDNGEVVGTSYTGKDYHAVLWYGPNIFDLNTRFSNGAGWVLEAATAINLQGQIVGYGKIGGQEHAFLLTPNPSN